MAYNNIASPDGISEVEELPIEEFQNIQDRIPKLYLYMVYCYFEVVDDEGNAIEYEDAYINNVNVIYENESYGNEIGEISINYSGGEFELEDEKYVEKNSYGAVRYNFRKRENDEFVFSMQEAFTVIDENVKLIDVKFVNNHVYEMVGIDIKLKTDDNVVDTKYELGTQLNIPIGSVIDYTVYGKSEKMVNSCCFKANPTLQFTFEHNGEKIVHNVEMSGGLYKFTKYEKYAVLVDKIDIFNMYYNAMQEETK